MTFKPIQAEAPLVPPVLYLPLSIRSTPAQQLVEIRQIKDGRLALLAFR